MIVERRDEGDLSKMWRAGFERIYYQGDALALGRPDPDADETLWNDYLHNRDNPSGVREDLCIMRRLQRMDRRNAQHCHP